MHSPPSTSVQLGGDVFLTGATGFLGTALLARLAADGGHHRVWALVRAHSDEAAQARLAATLGAAGVERSAWEGRVVAVAGDVTESGLGLSESRREEIATAVTHVIHTAASVSFGLPLDQARAINVDGTRRVAELAQLASERGGGLRLLSHVSTAYVAGNHRGAFGEDDHDVGQGFNNAYERSKWEAERLLAAYAGWLPIQILRPSIVVGEQDTGWTSSFNVIYSPLKAFARGALPALPARRSAPVDVVSVSYVTDGILALAASEAPCRTYHLTAGAATSTVRELVELSARRLERRPPVMVPPRVYRRLLHPLLLRRSSGARRRWLERSEVFFPYFSATARFDTARARAALVPLGVEPAPLAAYFDRLIDYAERTEWGRQPGSPAAADTAPAGDVAALTGQPATV